MIEECDVYKKEKNRNNGLSRLITASTSTRGNLKGYHNGLYWIST